MFQNERQSIIAQKYLSPRCRKVYPSRPSNQFYSWKNHLDPGITSMYNQIKGQTRFPKSPQNKQTIQLSRNYDVLTERYPSIRKMSQDRNCFSKVRIYQDSIVTPLEMESNSRTTYGSVSRSVTDQEFSNYMGLSKKDETATNVSMPKRSSQFKKQKQQSTNTVPLAMQCPTSQNKETIQDDSYHLKLKEEQRLYLLSQFMRHYQHIHDKKL